MSASINKQQIKNKIAKTTQSFIYVCFDFKQSIGFFNRPRMPQERCTNVSKSWDDVVAENRCKCRGKKLLSLSESILRQTMDYVPKTATSFPKDISILCLCWGSDASCYERTSVGICVLIKEFWMMNIHVFCLKIFLKCCIREEKPVWYCNGLQYKGVPGCIQFKVLLVIHEQTCNWKPRVFPLICRYMDGVKCSWNVYEEVRNWFLDYKLVSIISVNFRQLINGSMNVSI
jgi:hypothetical protein